MPGSQHAAQQDAREPLEKARQHPALRCTSVVGALRATTTAMSPNWSFGILGAAVQLRRFSSKRLWGWHLAAPLALVLFGLAALTMAPVHGSTFPDVKSQISWFWYWEKEPTLLETAIAPRPNDGRVLPVQPRAASGPGPKPVTAEFYERTPVSIAQEAFFETSIGAYTAGFISVIASCLSVVWLKWVSG
ncbi:Autotransporter domain-containing protein [Hyphomicrobium sp. 1Nfss2.1]